LAKAFQTLTRSFRQPEEAFELRMVFDVYNDAQVDSQAETTRASLPGQRKPLATIHERLSGEL
jgi:hypothetical protein